MYTRFVSKNNLCASFIFNHRPSYVMAVEGSRYYFANTERYYMLINLVIQHSDSFSYSFVGFYAGSLVELRWKQFLGMWLVLTISRNVEAAKLLKAISPFSRLDIPVFRLSPSFSIHHILNTYAFMFKLMTCLFCINFLYVFEINIYSNHHS